MQRLFWVFIILLLIGTVPAAAQEQSGGCDLNLVEVITALVEAQRAAAGGDTAAAVQTIETVQKQLEAMVASCARVSQALGRTYISPDGLFAFSYPDDWARVSPATNVFALSNNQRTLNAAVENNLETPLDAGSVVVVVGLLDMQQYSGSVDNFAEFVAEFQDEGLNPDMRIVSPIETLDIGGYEAREINIRSADMAGRIYLLNPDANNQAIVVIGLTPTGEFETFAPMLEAIAASARYGEDAAQQQTSGETPTIVTRPPGKSLDEITYVDAVDLRDLIPDVNFRNAVLSPDGTMIAWYTPQDTGAMCVYTFVDDQTICTAVPETFRSQPPALIWSPDSRTIAFTQDFVIYLHEADIWLYDVQAQIFTNATDDQLEINLLSSEVSGAAGPLWIDLAMTWGPDLNLYFIRHELPDPADRDHYSVGVYRLDPQSGAVSLIRDITTDFEQYAIYQNRELEFDGALSVSPDGQHIALVVLERGLESPNSGIWVMPLDGSAAPRQLVATTQFTPGLPAMAAREDMFGIPMGVAWSADGRSLYTLASTLSMGRADTGAVVYQIDVETGSLTPLNDFSGYTPQEIFIPDDSGYPPAFYFPRGAVMSLDGTTPLVFHAFPQSGQGGLSALRMVDGALQPEVLLVWDDYSVVPAAVSSAARDGKLLMWGYLFLPEE